jgi:Fe-S-cluster containining protein
MLAALPASVAEAFRQFPYEIKNGTCTKLGVDGRCTVYEERPVICNYTASWMAFGEDLPFDDEASFRIWNISQCRRLQREHEHGQQPTE